MAIKLLHLSDFHYKDSHDSDFKSIGEKIAKALENIDIDFVIFSGDLVFEAKSIDTYNNAVKCFIDPIKRVTGLDNSRFLIAPGNHDLKRNVEKPMVSETLERYSSVAQVDAFCEHPGQLTDSLENFSAFRSFINRFYGNSITIEPLYMFSTQKINNVTIGLIAFNSAWRCKESRADRGKLLYPVYMVREAFERTKDCDIIFCAQHHNISDYAEFIAQDIEDEINEHCHILFTGHYHKGSVQTTHNTEIGLLHLAAPATFNRNDKESKYGFSIIELDETSLDGHLTIYIQNNDSFIEVDKKTIAIPVSEKKRELNDFRRLLRKRYNETLEIADALFVSGEDGAFFKLFKNPIIKNKSVQEIIATRQEGQRFTLKSIIDNSRSAIIFGYNKRGKSSLLRWIQLELLRTCVSGKIVPFFVDSKVYKNGKTFDLMKLLHNYLEANYNSINERFKDYELLLLIDDFNPNDSRFLDILMQEMNKFPKVRFIATSSESMSRQCALINFRGTDIDKYYIHDITNKEIHQLTMSWPNITKDNKKVVEEKLMQVFTQMHISFNYWTASLFLWIFEKTDPRNIHNNFELLRLYIDELLGRDQFIQNDSFNTEYSDLLSFLAALAERILYTDNYALQEKELFDFTEEYRTKNKKFSESPMDIIHYLIENGTLHRNEGYYTIRLKGVFEFLLALRMTEDQSLLDKILSNKFAFMSFGNELEYYAGFKKKDFKTINTIFSSAKDILEPFTKQTGFEQIDERLEKNVYVTKQDVQCTGQLIERLGEIPEDDQYELLPSMASPIDETEIKVKQYYDEVPITATNVEHVLFILSRIYRNSNVCDDEKMSDDLLNYLINATCNLGFLLVDETKTYELNGDENAEELVKIVSNFMPVIIETFFYDAICQKNLVRVFSDKLKELMQDPQSNQFKIFIITFMLVDLDIKEHYALISEALNVITNKVLRYAILNKSLLLSIRNNDNPRIRQFLGNQRRALIKEFDGFERIDAEIDNKLVVQKNKELQQQIKINKDYN